MSHACSPARSHVHVHVKCKKVSFMLLCPRCYHLSQVSVNKRALHCLQPFRRFKGPVSGSSARGLPDNRRNMAPLPQFACARCCAHVLSLLLCVHGNAASSCGFVLCLCVHGNAASSCWFILRLFACMVTQQAAAGELCRVMSEGLPTARRML